MKATELRIGNYLQYDKRLHSVRGLDINHGLVLTPIEVPNQGYPCVHLDTIKPIPLTEEWLLKFGFEEEHDEHGYGLVFKFKTTQDVFMKVIYEHEFRGLYLDKNMNKGFYGFRFSNIDYKYVHQLQNLFYALCGEELTIK